MANIILHEAAEDRLEQVLNDITLLTGSRELSLVRTKLEEAQFWLLKDRANKQSTWEDAWKTFDNRGETK